MEDVLIVLAAAAALVGVIGLFRRGPDRRRSPVSDGGSTATDVTPWTDGWSSPDPAPAPALDTCDADSTGGASSDAADSCDGGGSDGGDSGD
jgi:hypothetical protein